MAPTYLNSKHCNFGYDIHSFTKNVLMSSFECIYPIMQSFTEIHVRYLILQILILLAAAA